MVNLEPIKLLIEKGFLRVIGVINKTTIEWHQYTKLTFGKLNTLPKSILTIITTTDGDYTIIYGNAIIEQEDPLLSSGEIFASYIKYKQSSALVPFAIYQTFV